MSRKLPKATELTLNDLKTDSGETKAETTTSTPDDAQAPEATGPTEAAPAARPKRRAAPRAKATSTDAPQTTSKTRAQTRPKSPAKPRSRPAPTAAAKPAPVPEATPEAEATPDVVPTPPSEPRPEPEPSRPNEPVAESAESGADTGSASDSLHHAQAREIVERYSAYAAIGGILPLPLLDSVSVFAIQVEMVRALSHLYNVPFRRDRTRAAVAALVTTVGQATAGTLVTSALARVTPGANLAGLAVSSVAALALSRTIGHTFIDHFEEGGTGAAFDLSHLRQKAKKGRPTTPTAPKEAPAAA